MPFLSVMPKQTESAVQGLADIYSMLFGDFGRSFQVLNTQVTAFHDEFVTLLQPGVDSVSQLRSSQCCSWDSCAGERRCSPRSRYWIHCTDWGVASSGLGLLDSAVVQLFSSVVALAIQNALGEPGLLGTTGC